MTRKPIPPRIAPAKKQVPQDELDALLKERLPICPETFDKV